MIRVGGVAITRLPGHQELHVENLTMDRGIGQRSRKVERLQVPFQTSRGRSRRPWRHEAVLREGAFGAARALSPARPPKAATTAPTASSARDHGAGDGAPAPGGALPSLPRTRPVSQRRHDPGRCRFSGQRPLNHLRRSWAWVRRGERQAHERHCWNLGARAAEGIPPQSQHDEPSPVFSGQSPAA